MGKVPVDVFLRIKYNIEHPDQSILETDMNRDGVGEVLEAWLRGQMGRGKDCRQAVERDVYTITVSVQLVDDTIITSSDTGNDSLTCGIVLQVFQDLDQFFTPSA